MDEIPISVQLALLGVLLITSGFFSLAETAMMAANHYRLKSAAAGGDRGARLALALLAQTDRLLGVVLLFNNLINAASATLVSVITLRLFGEERWALGAGTLAVTFLILVFAEITPKVIGANHAERLASLCAYVLTPLLRATHFLVAFINLFVSGLLYLLRLHKPQEDGQQLSPEELRMLVLESSHFIPPKHRSILINLFDLEEITVEDVMIPRGSMEAVDIALSDEDLRQQIATSYHTRLPVFDGEPNNIVGILHQRRMLPMLLGGGEFDRDALRDLLARPYFIPANTPAYSQLQFFQENHQRLGLVVDEYGEILGLVTLEDIIEELIGKFTTSVPTRSDALSWDAAGTAIVEGSRALRDLNRRLGLELPLDGPKTLNGLILEYLQDIPEAGLSLKIGQVQIEVLHTEDRRIKTAKLFAPAS